MQDGDGNREMGDEILFAYCRVKTATINHHISTEQLSNKVLGRNVAKAVGKESPTKTTKAKLSPGSVCPFDLRSVCLKVRCRIVGLVFFYSFVTFKKIIAFESLTFDQSPKDIKWSAVPFPCF